MAKTDPLNSRSLSRLFSPAALELLSASGEKLVQQIGLDVVRDVVYEVLSGRNLRDSTEFLTRRRVATLNLAIVGMLIRGAATSADFVRDLPQQATEILQRPRISRAEKWIAQWVLGLTDKGIQNILRKDHASLLTPHSSRPILDKPPRLC